MPRDSMWAFVCRGGYTHSTVLHSCRRCLDAIQLVPSIYFCRRLVVLHEWYVFRGHCAARNGNARADDVTPSGEYAAVFARTLRLLRVSTTPNAQTRCPTRHAGFIGERYTHERHFARPWPYERKKSVHISPCHTSSFCTRCARSKIHI